MPSLGQIILADFPTSLAVCKVLDANTIPSWNRFQERLVVAAIAVTKKLISSGGWLVCMCLPIHLPILASCAQEGGFVLHACQTVICEEAYISIDPPKEVMYICFTTNFLYCILFSKN